MKTKLFTLFAAVIMAANAMADTREYVDLGLPSGTLWATCNVGAGSHEEVGNYFAWGETQTKTQYDWETYTLTNGAYNKLTEYCSNSAYGNNGFTDTKTVLDASDDVATQQWGEGWHIPTQEQWQELIDHCTWQWQNVIGGTFTGTGYIVKSEATGRAIFLLISGFYNGSTLSTTEMGYYWSSTLNTNTPYEAYRVAIGEQAKVLFSTYRSYGQLIRPVHVPRHTITVEAGVGGTATGGGDYNEGKTATLTATPNAGYIFTGWSDGNTNNPRTVTVTQDSTFKAMFRVLPTEYVDLGLPSGTLWAKFNVGASDEYGRGDHFAWAETKRKDNYSWSTYKYGMEDDLLTKYCSDSNYGITDTKVVLDSIDDAATVNWGGKWRTPTIDEWKELIDSCTWEWQGKYEGADSAFAHFEYGYLVTSKTNGKQIFIPASGYYDGTEYTRPNAYGNYWSASLNESNPSQAHRPDFANDFVSTGYSSRREGLSVRPVQTADKYTIILTAGEGGTVSGGGDYFAGRTAVLTATANNGYAFVRWSDGVTENPRSIRVTADMTLEAEFEATSTEVFTPEYVDLGLSVLWATCNVGATAPEQAGDYFAWGETEPKENYSWSNEGDYKWGVYNSSASPNYGMTKYNKTDGKTVLDPEDDAATANWGGDWRMPTIAEQEELLNECTWEWTTLNGVNGYEVKGSNGNSIFLPAAGYRDDSSLYGAGSNGHYWSSSLNSYYPYRAYYLYFSSGSFDWFSDGYRCYGRSVRPVHPKDGILTGVETPYIASPDQVRKVFENGQVIIIRDGVRYNVLGIKVK